MRANNSNITTGQTATQPSNHDISINSDNYRALFEQATDAIMVTDFSGNFIEVNPGFCTMFGYTKDKLIGVNVKELIEEKNLEAQPVRFDLLAAGENIFIERQMLHKNGDIICVESNEKKFTENRILIIARNITERKRTENILQKSEANLHAVFDTTDTIYVLMDKDMRIISYNPRAEKFAENELLHHIKAGDYLPDYFTLDKRALLLSHVKAVRSGRHINCEISYPRPGNLFNWYQVKVYPIINNKNKDYGLMMAVSDITEKTVLELKLEEERIKKQQEITDAVITAEENERHQIGLELHDNVNQLLGSARLYVAMAKQSDGKRKEQMINEVDKLIDMGIKEIRSLSHSLITPFIEEYGLLDALDHLTDTVTKGSSLTIEKEMKINENDVPAKLKLTIYRIIQEQLNNILKHAGATRVEIKLVQDVNGIMVGIKDNGVGFDTSKISTGVGLMNIRTRASLFNGKTEIVSSAGNGCKLSINFLMNTGLANHYK